MASRETQLDEVVAVMAVARPVVKRVVCGTVATIGADGAPADLDGTVSEVDDGDVSTRCCRPGDSPHPEEQVDAVAGCAHLVLSARPVHCPHHEPRRFLTMPWSHTFRMPCGLAVVADVGDCGTNHHPRSCLTRTQAERRCFEASS